MSRISPLFIKKKNQKILNIYFTAGYPALDDTLKILQTLQECGADMVEIGMPFSDPLADGPVIQASSQQAIKNGMTLKLLLEQLKACRQTVNIPIILMGYLNPVIQYGFEKFLADCRQVGIDGLILPDLPLTEYEESYKSLFEQYDIDCILLVTPETSAERLKKIDQLCSGFIYAVSSSSTTGSDKNWNAQEAYFKKLQDSHLKNPVLTGFGVKDKTSFEAAVKYTDGAIIGTAFIKAVQKAGDLKSNIKNFMASIRN